MILGARRGEVITSMLISVDATVGVPLFRVGTGQEGTRWLGTEPARSNL